jgi:hypothetical protein
MAKLPGVPFDPALMRADQWLADIIYFPLERCWRRRGRGNAWPMACMVVADRSQKFPTSPA